MPPGSDSHFLFVTCQVGAEAALRHEVMTLAPELRPAFARPGLVTFKILDGLRHGEGRGHELLAGTTDNVDIDIRIKINKIAAGSVLARTCGRSLGSAGTAADAVALLQGYVASAADGGDPEPPRRLHVWERDRWRPGDEPPGFRYEEAASAAREALVAAWPRSWILEKGEKGDLAGPGEQVADVILGAPGEPWLVGVHRQRPGQSPYPGARIPVEEAPEAPSRAYYKLEEALVAGALPLRGGDVAVELGSAPGGASYALLRRGLEVHGIDPGAMDPRVLRFVGPTGNRLVHHRSTMGQVHRRDLPRELHWVVADVNLAPQTALQTVRRLAARPRAALQGVILTLKLDDWRALRHLPRWRRQIDALGMVEVGISQLSRNRMELFSYGLTAAGVARRRGHDGPGDRENRELRISARGDTLGLRR